MPKGPGARPSSSDGRQPWLPWLIAALSFVAFLPALRSEFVKLDDDFNFLTNTSYRGLGLEQLRWMFLTFQLGGVYQPLAWVTHGLDFLLWGVSSPGFHLTNMLLHSLTAVVFYRLASTLLGLALPPAGAGDEARLRWGGALAALLFSVHPLRVEVVAWASNRSYILPGLFYFACLWAYLEARSPAAQRNERRGSWLAISVACFALSLLSKAIGMTLPVVLLILDAYPLRRLGGENGWFGAGTWAVWREKIPFFLLSAAAAFVAAKGRYSYGAMVPLQQFGASARAGEALFGLSFYLEKTLVPLRLAPLYTMPASLHPLDLLCEGRTLSCVALTVAALVLRKRAPALAAAWASHAVTLSPVLGLSQYGLMLQVAADKWCHLASGGWAILAAGAWVRLLRASEAGEAGAPRPRVLFGGAWAAVAVLGCLSWAQTMTWHDTETMFYHNIAVEPDCYFCYNNLAVTYNDRKQYQRGADAALSSLRIKPDYVLAQVNSAVSLASLGRYEEAIFHAKRNIELDPNTAGGYFSLGYYLSLAGRGDEAIEQTRIAVRMDPNALNARNNLGFFLQQKGLLEEAIEQYREALRIDPNSALAKGNMAAARALIEARSRVLH